MNDLQITEASGRRSLSWQTRTVRCQDMYNRLGSNRSDHFENRNNDMQDFGDRRESDWGTNRWGTRWHQENIKRKLVW